MTEFEQGLITGFSIGLIMLLFVVGMAWRTIKDLNHFLDESHKRNNEVLNEWNISNQKWVKYSEKVSKFLQESEEDADWWKN